MVRLAAVSSRLPLVPMADEHEPSTGVCSTWAEPEDLCAPCADNDDLLADAERWLLMASNIVYALDGNKYPGTCEQTIRPCARRSYHRVMDDAVPSWWSYHPSWGHCSCSGPSDACSCLGSRQIQLGAYPVTSINEILIDGSPLDESEYRVDDWRFLVRLRDAEGVSNGWPVSQDLTLPDTEVGTWSVTFEWGRRPPPEGVHAVAVLACELAMSCDPELQSECRLPKTVTSVTREGVTMVLSPSDFLDAQGKTGLWEVDVFLRASNPDRRRRNAQVWTPRMGRAGRRQPNVSGS